MAKLLEQARKYSAGSVNTIMIHTYWEVGRRIVEHEQHGKKRAVYGEALIERLALDLIGKFGRGFSQSNLWQMRDFYLAWPILQTASGESRPAGRTTYRRARFLDAMTSVAGPIQASELRKFPTADCLHPEEVYEKEKLGPERLAHLQQCSWCHTMVSGSHSSPEDAAAWIRANESQIHTRRRVANRGRSTV